MKKYILLAIVVLCVMITYLLVPHVLSLSLERYVPKKLEYEIEYEQKRQKQAIATSTSAALRIPILIYHRVQPDHPHASRAHKSFSITPEMFDAQLKYLQDNGYTAISMDQLAIDLRAGTTSIPKPVVITFDDGWQDQYVYAFPLLMKYHDTAIFYIYTRPISDYPAFLTWNEIAEMQGAGMEIGSHTLTHPYLSRLTPGQMRKEVFESKKILEQHLGKPIMHFASPYGYTSPALVTLLQQAGYETGRTTYKGSYHSQGDELHLTGFLVHDSMRDFVQDLQ